MFTIAWRHAINEVLTQGIHVDSRDGGCRELFGWSFRLPPGVYAFRVPGRKWNLSYACAEFIWYLSGSDRTAMIEAYAPQYARFANDGIAYGAYGPRIGDQLSDIVDILTAKPNTRQAVLSIWHPRDLSTAKGGKKNDIPCTLSIQFLLREGRLDCMVTSRSSDLWLGLPYDVFCFTAFHNLVSGLVGVEQGQYFHSLGSYHIYDRDAGKLSRCEGNGDHSDRNQIPTRPTCGEYRAIRYAERAIREGREPVAWMTHPLLQECLLAAGARWRPELAERLRYFRGYNLTEKGLVS